MDKLIIREFIIFLAGCVAAGGGAGVPIPLQYQKPAQGAIAVATLFAMAHAAGMV